MKLDKNILYTVSRTQYCFICSYVGIKNSLYEFEILRVLNYNPLRTHIKKQKHIRVSVNYSVDIKIKEHGKKSDYPEYFL